MRVKFLKYLALFKGDPHNVPYPGPSCLNCEEKKRAPYPITINERSGYVSMNVIMLTYGQTRTTRDR